MLAPAASIDEVEEPSPYAVPEFQFNLDFVLGFVLTYAFPPVENPDDFDELIAALSPQYAAWLENLRTPWREDEAAIAVDTSALVGEAAPAAAIAPLSVLAEGGLSLASPQLDLVSVPEPGSAALIALAAGALALRRRIARRA